ncbi:MAG: hypothetical protein EOO36_17040 [Cytophagaceae bacterium]|nr:MAG: hypothetical protein EOO36_17040 [Cytophagaceae bacterium]
MSEPEAVLRLTHLGRGSLASFLRLSADGQVHLDLSTDQAQAHYHLLRRVVQRRTITQTATGSVEVVETEVELHDVVGAVDKLLQLHGAYPAFSGEAYSSDGPGTNLYLPDNGRGDFYPPSVPTQ